MSSATELGLEVRRLNTDELDRIYEIQAEAGELLSFYNPREHRAWLKKAIAEVRAGTRIAFGAFRPNHRHGFVGSAVLKRPTRRTSAELKNFIVARADLSDAQVQEVQLHLLATVERFCSVRGFKSLEVELPADLPDQISFFLNHEYRVSSIHQSRYRRRDYHYLLTKTLSRVYAGDPFDLFSIARWLVRDYFGFELDEKSDPPKAIGSDGSQLEDSFVFRIAPLTRTQGNSEPELRGACLYAGDALPATVLSDFVESTYDMKLLVSGDATGKGGARNDRPRARDLGFRVLSSCDIEVATGRQGSVALNQLDSDEVGGLFIVVGDVFRGRIEAQGGAFFYVLSNGLGHALRDGRRIDTENMRAVFVTEVIDSDGLANWEIWGHANIQSLNMLRPELVRDAMSAASVGQIWTSEELSYYIEDSFSANFNEHRRVTLLELGRPTVLPLPVSVFDSDVVSASLREYLQQFVRIGISSCYLDQATALRLYELDRLDVGSHTGASPTEEEDVIDTIIATATAVAQLTTASDEIVARATSLINKLRGRSEPDLGTSPVRGMLQSIEGELEQMVLRYQAMTADPSYDSVEVDRHRVIMASKALKLLEAAGPLKERIPEYRLQRELFASIRASYDS